MERALVVGLLVLAAGCLGAVGGTPEDAPATQSYEAYAFDHAGQAIDGGLKYRPEGNYTTRYYATVFASRADVARFDGRDTGAAVFLENTSFESSYVVVIQAFPASSTPDYRVENVRQTDGEVRVRINDSSRYATADITVETLLVRVNGSPPDSVVVTTEEGHTFDAASGVVTVTPPPTPTPDPGVGLPYTAANASENVAEPRSLRVVNRGNGTNGYRISVAYAPACRNATPPCGTPEVELLDRHGKLRAGGEADFGPVAARKGTYVVRVEASLPAANGSRRTIAESFVWPIDGHAGDATVIITADGVTFET